MPPAGGARHRAAGVVLGRPDRTPRGETRGADAGAGGQAVLPGEDAGAQPGRAGLRRPARDNRAMHLVIPYASAVSDALLCRPSARSACPTWSTCSRAGRRWRTRARQTRRPPTTRRVSWSSPSPDVKSSWDWCCPMCAASDGGRCPPYRMALEHLAPADRVGAAEAGRGIRSRGGGPGSGRSWPRGPRAGPGRRGARPPILSDEP